MQGGKEEGREGEGKRGLRSEPSEIIHTVSARVGFSEEVDMELLRVANYKELQEWEKCITLLIDEIHLKEDLVYDKVSYWIHLPWRHK